MRISKQKNWEQVENLVFQYVKSLEKKYYFHFTKKH